MKLKEGKVSIDIGDCDEPGVLELSVSKAKKWKSCQVAHDYKYVRKLRPKSKTRPLTLGGLIHECLEKRAEGQNWVQVIKDFKVNEWAKLFEEERIELGDIPNDAFRIMRGYHYYYLESDKRYKTIATEVPFRVRLKGTMIVLVGIIDLIVLDTTDNSIWCFEHKTAKRDIPTEEFRITDVQTTVYIRVMQYLGPTLGYEPSQVKGIILDYLKTTPPTIPEVLKNGTLSRRKIKCDRYTYLECIKKIGGDPADYQDMLEYMDTNVFYKRIPIVRTPEMEDIIIKDMITTGHQILMMSGTPHVTRNLSWTCDRPKCEYRDLCIAEVQGYDTSTLIKLNFDVEEDDDGKESDGDID